MLGVILVAAGSGRRFGGPKALVALEGVPLVERAAAPFHDFSDRVAVLREEDAPRVSLPGWKKVRGGARRRDSVAAGLAALDAATEVVLVHDAARPLATRRLAERVAEAARRAGAAVPVVAVVDTIKAVAASQVVQTEDRDALAAAQTPQGFRVEVLRRAYAASDRDAPDDAALVEALGHPVVTVEGEPQNVKITSPADVEVARALLRAGGT